MNIKAKIMSLCLAVSCAVGSFGALAAENHYDSSQSLTETEPAKLVTRAEFSHYLADFLAQKNLKTDYSEEAEFFDVTDENIYYNDIMILKKLSIIKGGGDNAFRPDENITYRDAAVMLCRLFSTDKEITDKYGGYPNGYMCFVLDDDLWKISCNITDDVNLKDVYTIINNLSEKFEIYDVMERLGCDTYNGSVYVDEYPKSWDSNDVNLSEKLLYSYDNVSWNTLYEFVDGKKVYSNLPENIDIEGARYAWEYGCFVSVPAVGEKKFYSYDNITWYEGEPAEAIEDNSEYTVPLLGIEEFPLGLDKENIILFDEESNLYFAWYPYEEETYTVPGAVLTESKHNMIWVSKDLKKWLGITIPDEMKFYTGIGLESRAKALIIDGAVEFTEEEKAYLDNEEKTAKELGLDYDRPRNKVEKYILRFSDVNKLFE